MPNDPFSKILAQLGNDSEVLETLNLKKLKLMEWQQMPNGPMQITIGEYPEDVIKEVYKSFSDPIRAALNLKAIRSEVEPGSEDNTIKCRLLVNGEALDTIVQSRGGVARKAADSAKKADSAVEPPASWGARMKNRLGFGGLRKG